jgi:K+-transporting ATPase ATPase C chain
MDNLGALYRHSLAGLRVMIGATLLLGVLYPLAVTGIARLTMPWHARGSLVTATGAHTTDPAKAVGSALLGQVTADPALFYDRPSAAGRGYDPTDSYGTNLGPDDPRLVSSIGRLKRQIAAREGVAPAAVPADAVTSSGSGLDPGISPAYAALQVPRVARATGLGESVVRGLVAANTHGRVWGVLGAPYVDVLTLNIAVRKAAH